MHMCVPFVVNLEPSERMKPGKGTFDDPARFTEATAMRRTDFGKQRRDAAFAQVLPVWLGTVAAVTLNDFRFALRASASSSNGRNRLGQRIELRNVVAIRSSRDDRERDALRVDDGGGLLPSLRRSVGFVPVFAPPASRGPKGCRQWHVPYRVDHDGVTLPTASRGCVARRLPLAMQPTCASTRCLSHGSFLVHRFLSGKTRQKVNALSKKLIDLIRNFATDSYDN